MNIKEQKLRQLIREAIIKEWFGKKSTGPQTTAEILFGNKKPKDVGLQLAIEREFKSNGTKNFAWELEGYRYIKLYCCIDNNYFAVKQFDNIYGDYEYSEKGNTIKISPSYTGRLNEILRQVYDEAKKKEDKNKYTTYKQAIESK